MNRELLRDLWDAIWKFRFQTLTATALMVAAKLAGVSVPLVLRSVIDDLAHPAQLALFPVFLVLAYALLRFLSDALSEARDVVFSIVTQRTVAAFTSRTFTRLHALGARFHAKRETGAIVRDVQKGSDGIAFLLGVALFTILPALVEIGSIVVIMASNYTMGFIAAIFATFVSYGLWTNIFTRRRMLVQREVNSLESQSDSRIVDSLLNHDTVKYFASEDTETARLNQVLEKWVDARQRNQRALTTLHVGQSAIIAAGITAVMLLAVQHVAVGRMTVGDLVLVNAYILQVCMPLNTLGFVFRETNDAIVNVERMFAILRAEGKPGEDVDQPDAQPLRAATGDIVFDHVHFGYEPTRPILHDVSFRAYSGKTIAVVGGSGSGKSTLVKLLFRLYEPSSGTVSIDGQDLREVTQRSLRQAIGIVPQDTILFNDTIAYNIAYGTPSATRADVVRAARAAQLDEFIERLPDHYDTRVGERGVRLSGGERQRIAIARAILKDPRVIVFDEATSALDTRSERAIQNELHRLAHGRTSIVIAHRLSTVVDADWILVMEHGRVVEQGTHDELIAQGGVYTQMWTLQRQQGELEHTQRKLSGEAVALDELTHGVAEVLQEQLADRHVDLHTVVTDPELGTTANRADLRDAIATIARSEIMQASPGDRIELRLERQDNKALLSIVGSGTELPRLSAKAADDAQATLAAFGGSLTLMQIDGRAAYAAVLPLRPVMDPPPPVDMAASALSESELDFPLDDSTPAAAAPVVNREPLRGCSLLIVDDEEESRDALELLLGDFGADVHLAASSRETLDFLDARPHSKWPTTLLCDIMLDDDADGYDVLREIRERETALGVPREDRMQAIAMTGFADADHHERALVAGFKASLTKPAPLERMIEEILRTTPPSPYFTEGRARPSS
ncbi:ATP-binding cassette domain-containing protein [Pigmentiphaga litoralis]|uniref:ATP-binding cassette subfamily B protein n=1 Tax=Pigmentiphaga litoralis TaxID=516702 RepID=A0A7Y9IW56_9BURK|nr:ATP-binding cassette domain-containing protein [Pigmentiphaga litoralis]NYE22194.1 ATP-binding cassette subfamily B protein [Pigmentiphaga litoralis]NYE84191.1 ATP-binding cassette subfamily B protein [Pigmentiphaga litoralis]